MNLISVLVFWGVLTSVARSAYSRRAPMTSARERFKSARLAAGFGQRAYARRIGKHYTTVLRWETGHTPVPLDELVRAARLCGVRREWLVFGSGSMRPRSATAEAD